MKMLVVVLTCIFISQNTTAQEIKNLKPKTKNKYSLSFSDPHLQFQNFLDYSDITTNSYQVKNSIEVFNKGYEMLFIIDKYGKHIFDLNTTSAKNELLEIPTSSWQNGSYEIIAIKNNEAYHHKIVKL